MLSGSSYSWLVCYSTAMIVYCFLFRGSSSLEPNVEPFRVFTESGCADSNIFNSDIDGLSSQLTTNIYDTITYCSQYQFNVASDETAEHCVDKPEVCGKTVDLVDSELRRKLEEIVEFYDNFPRSCKDIALKNDSPENGYHLVLASNYSFVEVYCNFNLTFGISNSKGWMRLMNVDMSQSGASCPDGLFSYTFPGLSYPLCDREHTGGGHCDSTFISTHGMQYSAVVGRVRGYQKGGLDGIFQNNGGSPYLDSFYVDGVSITYGSPRQHIWTYIGGQGEADNAWEDCPCNVGSGQSSPSYVGQDYYCESGHGTVVPKSGYFFDLDPIWDGQQCEILESPCCTNPNLPWFYKELNANVTGNIELRICSSEGWPDESTAVDQIEIYVQ